MRRREWVLLLALSAVAGTASSAAVVLGRPPCGRTDTAAEADVARLLGLRPPPDVAPAGPPVPLGPDARLVAARVSPAGDAATQLLAAYVEDGGRRHGPAVWSLTVPPSGSVVARDAAAAALTPSVGVDLDDDLGLVAQARSCARTAERRL